MGCGCNKAAGGAWEIVNADGTVQPTTYATAQAAQQVMTSQRISGYVRQRQTASV
jgi:hypothetical protein